MELKRLLAGVGVLCLTIGVFCGNENVVKANENNNDYEAEADSSSFSCVGSWADANDNNTFVLLEDGTGSLIQSGSISNESGATVGSTTSTSSITWEDKGDKVAIKWFMGSYDFEKGIENGQEVLKTEK